MYHVENEIHGAHCPSSQCPFHLYRTYIKPLSGAVAPSHCARLPLQEKCTQGYSEPLKADRGPNHSHSHHHVTSPPYLADRDQKGRKHPAQRGV